MLCIRVVDPVPDFPFPRSSCPITSRDPDLRKVLRPQQTQLPSKTRHRTMSRTARAEPLNRVDRGSETKPKLGALGRPRCEARRVGPEARRVRSTSLGSVQRRSSNDLLWSIRSSTLPRPTSAMWKVLAIIGLAMTGLLKGCGSSGVRLRTEWEDAGIAGRSCTKGSYIQLFGPTWHC